MAKVPRISQVSLSLALSALGLLAEGTPAQIAADGELRAFLDRATQANPRVLAARARVQEAVERHEGLREFFDPQLFAASGKAERARGVPGGSGWTSLANNAHELTAGVEVPVRPGFYLAAGASERFLFDGGGDYDHLYQTLLGLRVRVPLMRDRGFAQYEMDRTRAMAEYNAAVADLIGVLQAVRHDVERAYVDAYATLASYQVSQQATQRFRVLLEQARELARLKAIPAYQVSPTEMELAFRLEEEAQARQVHEVSLVALQRQIGDSEPVVLSFGADRLIQMAAGLGALPAVNVEEALERRGSYLRLRHQEAALRADLAKAVDDMKASLSLNASLTWRGEDAHQPFGDEAVLDEELLGGEVVVVWQRPLLQHGVRSRIAQARAALAEIRHQMAGERIALMADLQSAEQTYLTLLERLRLLEQAMEAARQTVTAEDERFRLGEGTSRNALDAQKDLTSALNRQAAAAAAILRALADYRFAAGYPDTAAP